eukprot:7076370-Prymnesium_polylepis.1
MVIFSARSTIAAGQQQVSWTGGRPCRTAATTHAAPSRSARRRPHRGRSAGTAGRSATRGTRWSCCPPRA